MDFCQGNCGSILKRDPVGENFQLKFRPLQIIRYYVSIPPFQCCQFSRPSRIFSGRTELSAEKNTMRGEVFFVAFRFAH
jgi:hypothetical protein